LVSSPAKSSSAGPSKQLKDLLIAAAAIISVNSHQQLGNRGTTARTDFFACAVHMMRALILDRT
jgi:hypothetical protein